MTNLPLLYKKTKTGAIQTSQISYHDDKFIVVFGQLNGKMQTQTTVCTSKNVGKANETTPSQQAALEAVDAVSDVLTENEPKPSIVKTIMNSLRSFNDCASFATNVMALTTFVLTYFPGLLS